MPSQTEQSKTGVPSRLIGPEEICEKEPVALGIGGLFLETTGIFDYSDVSNRLAELVVAGGRTIVFGEKVESIEETGSSMAERHSHGREPALLLVIPNGSLVMSLHEWGVAQPERIHTFRGEYFELAPYKKRLVTGLIYPVPDTQLPFLGVHLTKMISGEVPAGRNADVALARGGYRWRDISLSEISMTLGYKGSPKLATTIIMTGMREAYRSLSRKKFASDSSRLVPGFCAKLLVCV